MDMSLPVNGSREIEIHIKGLSEIEAGDWQGSRSGSVMACNDSLEDLEMEGEEDYDKGWEYDHREMMSEPSLTITRPVLPENSFYTCQAYFAALPLSEH